MDKTSRLPGFYDLGLEDRAHRVSAWAGLSDTERQVLTGPGLSAEQANQMVENVVGTYSLPLGVAPNFLINGRDYLIPMVIEEPSVVAAAAFMAR
ncbi:MAG: hydroxymethylglutaryl-CoA reductase, degradative, partial [Anaerolineae bacterium]